VSTQTLLQLDPSLIPSSLDPFTVSAAAGHVCPSAADHASASGGVASDHLACMPFRKCRTRSPAPSRGRNVGVAPFRSCIGTSSHSLGKGSAALSCAAHVCVLQRRFASAGHNGLVGGLLMGLIHGFE
jgi:hypothetical protein